jgi:hypothetical protein
MPCASYLIRNCSRLRPALSGAGNHAAVRPRPLHVSPVLGLRCIGLTLRPFNFDAPFARPFVRSLARPESIARTSTIYMSCSFISTAISWSAGFLSGARSFSAFACSVRMRR